MPSAVVGGNRQISVPLPPLPDRADDGGPAAVVGRGDKVSNLNYLPVTSLAAVGWGCSGQDLAGLATALDSANKLLRPSGESMASSL